MTGLVVFLGPTLPAAEVAVPCRVFPPARQGDIFRAVRQLAPAVVGLVDGVFLDVPAVWHREILWALDRGVHVLGASSMGALRAAELDRFGMVGVGRIYEAYRAGNWPGYPGPFEDDDEVAVVHAPAAAGGAALSDAMVDLRATLDAAVAAELLDRAECLRLAAVMKARAFAERSIADLASLAEPSLAAWIVAHRVRQKAVDAQTLLQQAAGLDGAEPFVPRFRFTRALAWELFVATAEAAPSSRVLQRMRQRDTAGWRRLRQQAVGRIAALEASPAADDAATRAALDDFRLSRGLVRQDDILAWLQQNGLDSAGLVRLMREEATLEATDPPGLEAVMLDLLRLSGGLSDRLPDASP